MAEEAVTEALKSRVSWELQKRNNGKFIASDELPKEFARLDRGLNAKKRAAGIDAMIYRYVKSVGLMR
ncbi:hypothetical protein HE1_01093 [Holospora elegans E1]|uniref:Uncharacterized protein n=1 Tax=Holospora elegans E1 TaxID=1427503 RepID=A0A023DYZ4_9PROT|nr:hypothetical protein [Holospora elegans]GAJ46754.1 hypothetical protein HE1_01093 [Holospora elegans E1]